MKHRLYLIFSVLFSATAVAQPKTLLVEGVSPNLYLTHTVAPKENFYSIGRLYNISPREIAPFNNLVLENGLSLNQVIRVPLKPEFNLIQGGELAADEAAVPLYYSVKEKEGLFRVGENHYQVPLDYLRTWNGLKADALPKGTRLIIGYLRIKKELSAFKAQAKPMPALPAVAVSNPTPAAPAVKPVVPEPQPTPPVKQPDPKPVTVTKQPEPTPAVKQPEPTPVAKTPEPTPKQPEVRPTEPTRLPTATPSVNTVRKLDGGAFKPEFDRQIRSMGRSGQDMGMAASFKSSSGWEDGRYYALHNSIAPGTIVKVTASATGKTVYVKVLDLMPDIKQNEGLLFRLSNAAADELGITDGQKFEASIQFAR